MIPEGDHSDPLNPCRNDEMGILIGTLWTSYHLMTTWVRWGLRACKMPPMVVEMSCCRVLLRDVRISALGGDLLVSVQLASMLLRGIGGSRLMAALVYPSLAPPFPRSSATKAWNRPRPAWNRGHPSLLCAHAVTPSMRPKRPDHQAPNVG